MIEDEAGYYFNVNVAIKDESLYTEWNSDIRMAVKCM